MLLLQGVWIPMKNLIVTDAIKAKLKTKHKVDLTEVEQCFHNKRGNLLMDNRAAHKTDPPTLWFIAQTNKERMLKIVYIQINGEIHLKTAYEANEDEKQLYRRHG
jgi:uncharacterized DUF497 family protein